MSDDAFPSGEWTGFYNYAPADKHRMDIALEFAKGSLSGAGCDGVGQFVLKGHYDSATKECTFTKSYLGAHSVFYRGFREGKGIWGTWEIGAWFHGGFHIWPRKEGSTDSAIETVEMDEPVEAFAPAAEGMEPEAAPAEIPYSQSQSLNRSATGY